MDQVRPIAEDDYELVDPRFLSAEYHVFEDGPALKLH